MPRGQENSSARIVRRQGITIKDKIIEFYKPQKLQAEPPRGSRVTQSIKTKKRKK